MFPTRRVVFVAALFLLAAAGCRKKAAAPAARPADPATCPAAEALARLVQEPDRTSRTDCLAYAPGFFWLGAALTFDTAGGGNPRLSLIYGGPAPRAFTIEPLPQEVLARLIHDNPTDLRVSVRKPSAEGHLVRIGVFGLHGGEQAEADEMVTVLKLVAHAPPQLLWTGPGDQVRTSEAGCVAERTVDFDMPFGDRLEMTTMARSHRKDAKSKVTCPAGQNTQQTLEYKGQPLKPSSTLPGAPAAPG
jgi:hypothetical protein